MPMYEFFCKDCNTIFTFFSKIVTTQKTPLCPKCQKNTLSRMISRFAITGKHSQKEDGDSDLPDIPVDEAKMEKAIESLASEAENINEDDPRQAANLLRRLTDMTGLKMGDKMEEAISRMEDGADPETIEQEMGDIPEEELFKFETGSKQTGSRYKVAPIRDETLYEM